MVKGDCDSKFLPVKEIFSEALASGFETGAAIAIEHKGKLVVNLWGGYKDLEKTKEWKEDTLVNVFSVTKGITATCAARLIDKGKLNPNQKVSHYWPEYNCNGKENTKVSDILCHRAGMFGFKGGIPSGSFQDWSKFVKHLEAQSPYRKPGLSQGYHALTYGWLVGEIIRKIDGRTVGQYFKEEIAEPLGIDFYIGLPKENFSRCADMILIELDSIKVPGGFLKYIPDFVLPKRIKNFKEALKSGDFEKAFEFREEDSNDFQNSEDWRIAEIPSANGHGTAKSLAKLYGILSNGCSRNGIEIMNTKTLELAISIHSSGPDSVLFGADIKFGLGYELSQGISFLGNVTPIFNNKMFGHAGIGGAVAFGDPEKNLGYGFICNQQHKPKEMYKTNNQLTKALYSIIENF